MKKLLKYVIVGILGFFSALGGATFIQIYQIKGGGVGTFVLTSVNGLNNWTVPATATPWQNNIIPSGTPNGTLTTFTLPTIPTTPSSIQLYRNGIIQQQSATGDYTFTGSTITFLAASIPQTGDTLIVWYY
jgi:hypothetical protein